VSFQSWQETLIVAQSAGQPLFNTTTATSLLPGHAKATLPPSAFATPGKQLRILAAGRLSNLVATPGTLTLDVRLGATVVFSGATMQMSTTAHTNAPWWLEILLTCRTVGSTANLMGQGHMLSQALSLTAVADSATTPAHLLLPNTAPAVGGNFDATATQVVDLFGAFSVASASNSITVEQYSLILMN
jgi:hypothetical protein